MANPTPGPRNTLLGFAVAAALFAAVDGYLIGALAGALAGGILGAAIGAGMVLLALRPRPHDATSTRAEPAHHPRYLRVWMYLFALTAVEVSVAFLSLSRTAILVSLLLLAVWKALLVAMYYMHLKYEPRRLWLVVASPIPLVLILVGALFVERWGG